MTREKAEEMALSIKTRFALSQDSEFLLKKVPRKFYRWASGSYSLSNFRAPVFPATLSQIVVNSCNNRYLQELSCRPFGVCCRIQAVWEPVVNGSLSLWFVQLREMKFVYPSSKQVDLHVTLAPIPGTGDEEEANSRMTRAGAFLIRLLYECPEWWAWQAEVPLKEDYEKALKIYAALDASRSKDKK